MTELSNGGNVSLEKLEEGMGDIKEEIKELSDRVLRLTVIHETRESSAKQESSKLLEIDRDMQQAKGVITFVKFISTIGGGSVLALIVWLLSSQNAMQQRISDVNQRTAIIEAQMVRIEGEVRNQINKIKIERTVPNDERGTTVDNN